MAKKSIVNKEEILDSMMNAGLEEDNIKREIRLGEERLQGFVKNPEIITYLTALKHGIPCETPKLPSLFRGGGGLEVKLSDISSDLKDKNITTSGFILKKKKGKTKSGNKKITLTLTDGSSIMNASIFGGALEQYKANKFDIFEKIKLSSAKQFSFTPEDKDEEITIVTAGDYTDVHKINKDISDSVKTFKKADEGSLAMARGVVIETLENSYIGCPDCYRKKKGEDNDLESEMECECGYGGLPVKHTNVNAVVTDGEDSTVVSIFTKLKVKAKDIAYKPVVVVGKKNENKIDTMAINVYDVNKKHKQFFKKNGEDEVEDIEETDDADGKHNGKKNHKAEKKIKGTLKLFPNGIYRDALVDVIITKNKGLKRKIVYGAIDTLKITGEVVQDTNKIVSLSDN